MIKKIKAINKRMLLALIMFSSHNCSEMLTTIASYIDIIISFLHKGFPHFNLVKMITIFLKVKITFTETKNVVFTRLPMHVMFRIFKMQIKHLILY